MPFRLGTVKLDKSAGPFRRALQYAFYDWASEMPRSKRIITYVGIALQGYAFYFTLMWALMLPIQQTLQPRKLEQLPGYEVEAFYKPLREVGGDYFDVIELPANRTLFALADVSGKGIPAALLAANIQALVRSIASVESTPLALAKQINKHLSRYTPSDRFATAVFIVLSRDSGEVTYVNAGHNAPIVFSSGSTTFLEGTGPPLGLFIDAEYEGRTTVMGLGATLLVFTDGLTDSIQGNPENRLRDAFAESAERTMANLKSLVDPKFNEDDITILLVKRVAGSSSGVSA
jgi:sigma-B regulation protein RsbU (phosphoserine phosphatase)